MAVAMILQAAPVIADSHSEKKNQFFEKHDADGDGTISKDEFISHTESMFMEMDADGDGSVSQEEAKTKMQEKRGKMKDRIQSYKEKKEMAE